MQFNDDDDDGDGLFNSEERDFGTDPDDVDTDNDRVWDGEEAFVFLTNPRDTDTDNDGMDDRADPRPRTSDVLPPTEHAVFTQSVDGTGRTQLVATRMQENHIVQAPNNGGVLLYQTYLQDVNADGDFDEADFTASAIALMNLDGSRPGLLTDFDDSGARVNNGWIDVTPHWSPDGTRVIWASDRHNNGGGQLRLYVMERDGDDKRQLTYQSNAPASDELDSDPHWSANDRVVWKRERITSGAKASRLYTATLNRSNWRLENVTQRTNPAPGTLNFFPPGDYDAQLSPDGNWVASYRHLTNTPGPFGDWDVFVGRFSDAAQPADSSLTFLLPDATIADFFPRWNAAGNRLALWSIDSTIASGDATDVWVFDLNLAGATPSVTTEINVTAGASGGWAESMPSWSTSSATPDKLYFSASR
ncbi:MAG: PD40 domain-containing protein [Deltaproteobacteria bacterium]|nr:PD40 domain-containing protein [Deltaproteobacteria bacterium]